MSGDDAIENIEEAHNKVRDSEGKTQKEEEKLDKEEGSTEEGEESIKRSFRELEEGSADPYAEIKNAEEKERKILNVLKDEEKLTEKILKDIEYQLKGERKEEELIEREQDTIQKEIRDSYEKLEEGFKNIGKDGNAVRKIRTALNEIKDAARKFDQLIEEEGKLEEDIKNTEKEEYNLEKASAELLKELKIDEEEIKRLLSFTDNLDLPEDADRLERIGNTTMEEFMEHWNREGIEEEKIDNAVEKELEELREILEQNEEILQEFKEIEELMEKIEANFGDNARPQFYQEMEDTRRAINNLLNEDGKKADSLENSFPKLTDHIPSGPSTRSQTGSGYTYTAVKYLTLLAAAVAIYYILIPSL